MKKILATLSAIGVLASVSAFATPITGSSTGTLSGPSGNNPTVTQVYPYQLSWKKQGGNPLTYLTAGTGTAGTTSGGTDAINQDYLAIGGSGVKLASLTWNNKDNLDDKNFNINWGVAVTLTDPSFASTLATNTLDVKLTHGGGGNHPDTIALDSLSGLSWTFGTWVAKNFRYVVNDAELSGLEWKTAKNSTSTLLIEADFKNTPVVDPGPAPVPEPGTMMLLSAGFLGLAVYSKRRKSA